MTKLRKKYRRKNPVYLREVIGNAKCEIGVLETKLESGEIPVEKAFITEVRICTLMNVTIPNAEASLEARSAPVF